MRVVYLHQYFNTCSGGTRSFEMARRLVAKGHDVQMVTSDRTPEGNGARSWHRTTEDGIQVHWLPVPYSNYMSYAARMRAFVRFAWAASARAADLGGDVVFATSTPLTIAVPGIYASLRNRVPMVLEVRDLWPSVPVAMGALRNPASIAAARWLERTAYRRSTRIVALSPTMKAGIARSGYPESQITVIPNACDLAVFDLDPECGRQLRNAHLWLRDRRLVVYAGALGRVNGVDYIARLAAEVGHFAEDICFVVVGEGIEERKVRTVAEQLGVLGRNFFMLPTMPKADVARWLSAADVAMSVVVDLPALWANSANKVFDALAASRPVAINHEGWLADLFRESGAGLVLHPADINHAALTLIQAIRDRDWVQTAGAAARELAFERFHRDQLAAQLERVLEAAVDDRCSRPLEHGFQSSGSRQHG